MTPTCPVVALQTWLNLARIAHGPLFRRVTGQGKDVGPDRLLDQEVARLVKKAALAAGVRPCRFYFAISNRKTSYVC